MEHNNQCNPYWKWGPAAFALAGIIVFIFATYGPPAASSGFVSALKGFFQWAEPEYAASKAHYKAIPGPGSWLFAFVLGMARSHLMLDADIPRFMVLAVALSAVGLFGLQSVGL